MNVMRESDVQVPSSCYLGSELTPHAEMRMQQRGVDREILACLLQYGRPQFGPGGCEILLVDDATLDAVARHESRRLWLRMAAARDVYAVVDSDGCVLTTGHRYRRVLRDVSLSSRRPGRSRSPRSLRMKAI